MLTVPQWLAAQIDMPPLAANDPDLLLDIDFRNQTDALSKLSAFTHVATGEQWDTTLGWNPGQSGRFYTTTWAGAASLGTSFTIYAEVQRSAIASTFADAAGVLLDCSNGPSGSGTSIYGATGNGVVFQLSMSSGNFDLVTAHFNTNAGPVGRLIFENRINATSGQGQAAMTVNDNYLNTEDQYVKIAIVCDGIMEYYYIDGQLRGIYIRTGGTAVVAGSFVIGTTYVIASIGTTDFTLIGASSNTVGQMFTATGIGSGTGTATSTIAANVGGNYTALRFSDDGSGTSGLRGWIRRIQVIKRACKAKNYTPLRLGVIWDSYGVRGTNQANPSVIDVAHINGVQNMLNDSILNGNPNFGSNPVTGPYYCPTMFALQKMAALNGARFRLFNASDSGHGWASDIAQIRQAFFDAMGQYDPEILICGGSVNDVNYSSTPAANLLGDIQNRLTYVAAQCRNLRKILFIETFPPYKNSDSGSFTGPAKQAEYNRQLNILPNINNYAVTTKDGRTVTVQYVKTYDLLGNVNYNSKLHLGGSVERSAWKALYGSSAEDGDVHPGQYGMNRMAEIIWQYLSPYILSAASYY